MSGASKLNSSTSRSMIVYSRRAPMFCVVWLTWKAIVRQGLDGVRRELQLDSLGAQQRRVLLRQRVLGSVRIRTKSSLVRSFSSTRIGKRPCSSGIRSLGLARWNAPAAMNRMWSVLT